MSSNKASGSSALVEPIILGEADLSTLSLSHNSEQYSSDYEAFASIDTDLECINAEEVTTTEDDTIVIEETVESDEIISPDIEMTDVSEENISQNEQIIYTTANQNNQNVYFQTKPTLQRVPMSAVQVKSSMAQPTQSQSIMILSPPGGQGASQLVQISHPASASPDQLQSIAQSFMAAKSAEGNIVHVRHVPSGKNVANSQSNNISIQATKTAPVKRPAQPTQQNKNIFTKMIITGSQSQPNQELIIATSQDNQPSPAIKFVSNSTANQSTTKSTKTITFAQAQQMGLLSPNKVHHIMPSSTAQKQQQQGQIIVNKVVQSSASQPPKLTLIPPSSMKSPTKILPAPAVSTQVRTSTMSNSPIATYSNTSKVNSQQNTQKVIIRQNPLKPGTVLNSGQIIRIPANQNVINSNQVHQIQMPGRQVQYVRLVSTASSGTSNVMTVGKSKMGTGLQTMGVAQKVSGQQQIVKVVPLNTGGQPLRNVAPKTTPTPASSNQRIIIPAGSNSTQKSVAIPAATLSQLATGQTVISTNPNVGNIVVLPAQYLQQQQQQPQQQQSQQSDEPKSKSTPTTPSVLSSPSPQTPNSANLSATTITDTPKLSKSQGSSTDSNGIRPRKPCNCTKSQCLKLYCDCFANGEFCHMCNCNNCSNNLGNEEERQRAIKSCLERNPNAFRPKIGKGRETGDDIRRHNKGCNCKRSGCLKNYCECYEAKIPCSANCKCIGCRNIEEPALEKKSLKDLAEAAEVRTTQLTLNKSKIQQLAEMAFRVPAASNTGARQPFNFLTDKVVEITCQCLIAQAEEADKSMFDEETSQRLIIEEFGRCLKEIIESAHKAESTASSSTNTTT